MPRYEWTSSMHGGVGRTATKTAYVIPWPRRRINWATGPPASHAKTPAEEYVRVPRYNCICGHVCQNIHDVGSAVSGVSQPEASGCCRCRRAQMQFRIPLGPPFQAIPEQTADGHWVPPHYADKLKEGWETERTWSGFSAAWTKRRYEWHTMVVNSPPGYRCDSYNRAHQTEGRDKPTYLSTKEYGLVPNDRTLKYTLKQGKLLELGYWKSFTPVRIEETSPQDGAPYYKEAPAEWVALTPHHQLQPTFKDARHLGWHAGLYRPVLLHREGWWTDQHTARKQFDFLGITSGMKDSQLTKMCIYCQVTAQALPPYLFWMARGYTKHAAQWMTKQEQKRMDQHLKAGRITKGKRKFSWGVLPGVVDTALLPREVNASFPD